MFGGGFDITRLLRAAHSYRGCASTKNERYRVYLSGWTNEHTLQIPVAVCSRR